jgi:hypothetical protein
MSSGSIIKGVVKGVAVICAIIVLLVVLSFAWFMFVFAEDASDPSQARFSAVLITLIVVGASVWAVYAFLNPKSAEAGPAQGGERSDRRTCATCGKVFQDEDYLNEPVPERYTCTRCGVADGP